MLTGESITDDINMSGWHSICSSLSRPPLLAAISSFVISFEIGALEELQAFAIILYSIKNSITGV